MTTLRACLLTLSCGAPLVLGGCDELDDVLGDNQDWDNEEPGLADTGTPSSPPEVEWLTPEAGANLSGEDDIILEVEVSEGTESVEYRICRLDGDCSQGSSSSEDEYFYGGIATVYPPNLAISLHEHFIPPSGNCVLFQAHARNSYVDSTDENIQVCF